MHAVVDGTPILGDYGQGKDKVPAALRPDSPTIRVKGVALMGSVQVVRLPPPGTPRKFIGTLLTRARPAPAIHQRPKTASWR